MQYALTKIYGVGLKTAHRLCARFQIHDKCKMRDLTPFQVTSLASFLSSPHTSPPLPRYPLASPDFVPPPASTSLAQLQAKFKEHQMAIEAKKQARAEKFGEIKAYVDPLKKLKIDTELRREIRENIAHQRMIGSYVGRRHAMHLPVRGQGTRTNAKTAKRLNKLERW